MSNITCIIEELEKDGPITQDMKDRLNKAFKKLNPDPLHDAEMARVYLVRALLSEMQEKGFSLLDMARRMGLSKQQISLFLNLEVGHSPTLKTCCKYAAALGLRIELLISENR